MEKELEIVKIIAEKAGQIIMKYFNVDTEVFMKQGQDFALQADLEAEKYIIEEIKKYFPDDGILSEEAGEEEKSSERRWVIDPLDGTANFKAGIPYFCIPIALEFGGKITLAVIHNPVTGDTYHASKGYGAFLNGQRINVSVIDALEAYLVSYSTSNHKNDKAKELGSMTFARLLQRTRAVRLQGSSILDLCYLASGKFDALIKVQASYWDFAAGCLLVEEAGGKITNYDGSHWSNRTEDLIATNNLLHDDFVAILQ